MANFTAKDVQNLRAETGAGMMDAKKALVECDGDLEKARTWLRENGLAGSLKRSARENTQGALAIQQDESGSVLVEVKCETDFVAKSQEFVTFVEKFAAAVLRVGEGEAKSELEDELVKLKTTLKENIDIGKVSLVKKNDNVIGSYLHLQNGRGVNGVLVELDSGSEELAHDIAVHIAFAKPLYLSREEIPESELEKERSTIETISKNEGKPEAALPKIIEGRLNGWYKEICLLDQAYVKDEKVRIQELLGASKIKSFIQAFIGD